MSMSKIRYVRRTMVVASLNFVIIASLISGAVADELAPFTSDGCSAFPDGTFGQNKLWLKCCTAHDFAYWKGGTYSERKAADGALKVCVAEVGQPEIALLMLAGVRVGGTPFLPTGFRWGYGWSYPRLYGPLSEQELLDVNRLAAHKYPVFDPPVLEPLNGGSGKAIGTSNTAPDTVPSTMPSKGQNSDGEPDSSTAEPSR